MRRVTSRSALVLPGIVVQCFRTEIPSPLLLSVLSFPTGVRLAGPYRSTSLVRNSTPLGPYSKTMPRAYGDPRGGVCFLGVRYPCRTVARLTLVATSRALVNVWIESPCQLTSRALVNLWIESCCQFIGSCQLMGIHGRCGRDCVGEEQGWQAGCRNPLYLPHPVDERERVRCRQPTGPNPLYHRDD